MKKYVKSKHKPGIKPKLFRINQLILNKRIITVCCLRIYKKTSNECNNDNYSNVNGSLGGLMQKLLGMIGQPEPAKL